MAKVMMTIRAPRDDVTVETIRHRYALTPIELDEEFGVIPIDSSDHAYTILVDENAVDKLQSHSDWEVSGPFSNPRIGPTNS